MIVIGFIIAVLVLVVIFQIVFVLDAVRQQDEIIKQLQDTTEQVHKVSLDVKTVGVATYRQIVKTKTLKDPPK